jgi:hypothetical protein
LTIPCRNNNSGFIRVLTARHCRVNTDNNALQILRGYLNSIRVNLRPMPQSAAIVGTAGAKDSVGIVWVDICRWRLSLDYVCAQWLAGEQGGLTPNGAYKPSHKCLNKIKQQPR